VEIRRSVHSSQGSSEDREGGGRKRWLPSIAGIDQREESVQPVLRVRYPKRVSEVQLPPPVK
jgi:hypothetical protein